MTNLPCTGLLVAAVATVALAQAPPPTSRRAEPPFFAPRLLLRTIDVDRIRLRCGTRIAGASTGDGRNGFATHASDFRIVRQYADENLALTAEPGGLYPAAFMHLATGEPGISDKYSQFVERSLQQRTSYVVDFDDAAVAFDWCFDALTPEVRRQVAKRWSSTFARLSERDRPFEHALFHPKLCHLATALAARREWPAGTPNAERATAVIDDGKAHLSRVLPVIAERLRGTAPTPAIRGDFESDIVFAAELWQSLDEEAWTKLAAGFRDMLDVYLWSDTQWPGLTSGLLHDAGTTAPLRPGTGSSAFAAGIAEVLARRTGSPAAAYFAAIPSETDVSPIRRAVRAMLRIIHGDPSIRPAHRERLPLARRLGNQWVLMRGDWGIGATLVAFDAGQSFDVARQHLDTGQFQIVRKGRLAIDSGDDVALEAIRPRGGEQNIGDTPSDFDLYAASTLAHNCVTMVGPRETARRIGENWIRVGNQRSPPPLPTGVESAELASQRITGRLLAFGTNELFSYALADIAKAYSPQMALVFDRGVLFIHDGLVLVVDRIERASAEVRTSWLLHVPSAPRIDGEALDPALRRRAEGATAGTWVFPNLANWLSCDDGDGRLYLRVISPAKNRVHLIGGPADVQRIPRGSFQGRPYIGGSPRGFEYWLSPAPMKDGANAWYRLGQPATLGDAFGSGSSWGRIEVEAVDDSTSLVFVHALYPCDRRQESPPKLEFERRGETIALRTILRARRYTIVVNPYEPAAGFVEVHDAGQDDAIRRPIPTQIEADRPIPTE